ncbi:MAG: iron-sulfur cluster repair di-iron protein [Dethiosulfatibacter sp.]|nr:iron-sulfur cluster repair di-iron protein [Dethiosulfatibacter sp.]
MNTINKNITVGDVAVLIPNATEVFAKYDIDFCCGGNRILADVIKESGLNENQVFEELEELLAKRRVELEAIGDDFAAMKSAELSLYIENTHHTYLKETLPVISDLLNQILKVHGKNHNELYDIHKNFGLLKTDLDQHLIKEETILFPLLREGTNKAEISRYINEILQEHEVVGDALRKIRKASNKYTVPEDGCDTYRQTYKMLEELQNDLHQHVHLENNILLNQFDKEI